MIEHDASGASGSGDRSGVGKIERQRRRGSRSFALGCFAVVLVVGAVFWREVAIIWCWTVARVASDVTVIGWNESRLADLGPRSLPALARLAAGPSLQRTWSAFYAVSKLHEREPEANAPIHDLLLAPDERVRAVAGWALIATGEKDPTGFPAAIEGLSSPDLDVRVLSGYYVACSDGDEFVKAAPDAPRAFESLLRALQEGLNDPRRIFMHGDANGPGIGGQYYTVDSIAKSGFQRIDDRLLRKDALAAALADPAAAMQRARTSRGTFFSRR